MYINMYGCDQFMNSIYRMDYNITEPRMIETDGYGTFPDFYCYNPRTARVGAFFYFFTFTIFTAFIILSLLIGSGTERPNLKLRC